jgi:hypothetical protein
MNRITDQYVDANGNAVTQFEAAQPDERVIGADSVIAGALYVKDADGKLFQIQISTLGKVSLKALTAEEAAALEAKA